MKSFNRYIISETKQSSKKSIVPMSPEKSKQTTIYGSVYSAIPNKTWMTDTGDMIEVPEDSRVHHLQMVVDDPKRFKTSTAILQRLDPENYQRLIDRKESWSEPILRHLGKKGFMRVMNNSSIFKTYTTSDEPSSVGVRHYYQVTNHGNHDPAVFVEPLKHIRKNIANNMQTDDDTIRVMLEGRKLGKSHHDTTVTTHSLKSLGDIDNFIKNHETRRERIGTLPDVPHMPTSTQLRSTLGRNPPTGIPQAIWNNMRTIGDSHVPILGFKSFLNEVLSWKANTLFAIGPSGNIEYHHDPKTNMIEHPDAFKHLNFMDRPHSGEVMIGIKDLRDPEAEGYPSTSRPKAVSWGRLDHENKIFHIVTQHGMTPYGVSEKEKNKRIRERDVFDRLYALKKIRETYPDYQIQHGHEGEWISKNPRIISTTQYEKELMQHLAGE